MFVWGLFGLGFFSCLFFPLPFFPAFESRWDMLYLALLHESLPGEPALRDTAALLGKGCAGVSRSGHQGTGEDRLYQGALLTVSPVPTGADSSRLPREVSVAP